MMVLVHRERRVGPAGRADLYHQVCDVMLWRRQESKRLQVEPSGPVRLRMLAAVAYKMMASGVRGFARGDILEIFERLLDDIDTVTTAEALAWNTTRGFRCRSPSTAPATTASSTTGSVSNSRRCEERRSPTVRSRVTGNGSPARSPPGT